MDFIHQCLSLAPVPYLAPAFSALRLICSSVEQAQASKRQLEALAQSIAQLLQTLNGQYRAGRLLQARTSTPLADLRGFVVLNYNTLDLGCLSEPIIQLTGRNFVFCSQGSLVWVFETPFHQRSKDLSDQGIPPTHRHFSYLVSGKSSVFDLLHQSTSRELIDISVAEHSGLAVKE
jgi:hypothetical protein